MKKSVFLSFVMTVLTSTSSTYAQIDNYSAGSIGLYWCDIEPDGTFGYECNGTAPESSLTTGDYNTLIGDVAGSTLSRGSYNTFLGHSAGKSQTTATDNTFIGQNTGFSNTIGVDNTFIGVRAGFSNTATDNTFVGAEAGRSNTGGTDNTFIGEQAGYANTTGRYNTFIGEDAGYENIDGDENTAIGRNALRSNVNGKYNTAVGSEAGADITETSQGIGVRNTVVGNHAGHDMSSGIANTMVGGNAGPNTEYAHFNTFVGFQAGFDNNYNFKTDNANRNTALGAYAGYTNREGEDNLWIGALSNSGIWDFNQSSEVNFLRGAAEPLGPTYKDSSISSMNQMIYRTTVVGTSSAGLDNDTVTLGYSTRAEGVGSIAIGSTTQARHANSIAIGYGATAKTTNSAVIGNDLTTSLAPNIDAVTALGTTAYRFTDVVSNKVSVNAVAQTAAEIDLTADNGTDNNDQWTLAAADGGDFSISSFATGSHVSLLTLTNTGTATLAGDLVLNSDRRLKKDIQSIESANGKLSQLDGKTYQWKDSAKGKKRHYGLIAQDVEKVLPELVGKDNQGMRTVNYQGLIPVLLNALKEQQAQINTLEKQLSELKHEMERQDRSIEPLN